MVQPATPQIRILSVAIAPPTERQSMKSTFLEGQLMLNDQVGGCIIGVSCVAAGGSRRNMQLHVLFEVPEGTTKVVMDDLEGFREQIILEAGKVPGDVLAIGADLHRGLKWEIGDYYAVQKWTLPKSTVLSW